MKICFIYVIKDKESEISSSIESFQGESLLEICINKVRKCDFSKIVLLTNCNHAKLEARKYSIECIFEEQKKLSGWMSIAAKKYLFSYGFFINPDYPNLEQSTIMQYSHEASLKKFDSSFSCINSCDFPLWKNNQPYNFSINYREEPLLEPCVLENNIFYIRSRDSIIKDGNLYSGVIKPLVVSFEEMINSKFKNFFNFYKTTPIINKTSKDPYQYLNHKNTWLKK